MTAAPPPARLRARAVLVALPLIVLDAFWIVQAERIGYGPKFTTISLFANVFFLLTVLLAVNAGLRRLAPRQSLSRAELLLIYAMVSVGAAVGGQDTMAGLVQMIGHPYRFATPANGWLDRFGQFLPAALTVSDKTALDGFYQGNASLYRREILAVWAEPVLLWTGFLFLLFGVMLCLNVLVRQGWQERERLPFPILEIPLQMTDPAGTLWKNKLFWLGFSLCATLELLNGLAWLYPSLPEINVKHVNVLGQGIFATRPWNAVGFTCYSFYPFVIGLGYLLPLDLLFSCWFFYLFWKAQLVVSAQLALDAMPEFPFVKEQAFGGYMAILAFAFYNGRHYFKAMGRKIAGEPTDLDDKAEGLTYRQAALGVVAGTALLVLFLAWAGLSPLVAAAALGLYLLLSLAITRMRAELGPPVHDLHWSGADQILPRAFGTPAFSGRDLTVLSFFHGFDRAYRSHPQPVAIEGLKAASDTGASQKVFVAGMLLAALVGVLSMFWAYLHLAYTLGAQAKFSAGSNFAQEAYARLNGMLQTPTPPNGPANGAIGVGFVFGGLLMLARSRFPWWPFHPIGYAISGSWSINLVWMPLFFAWVVKGVVMRYGGVRMYRQMMPFFLGLILGQMLVGSAWHLIGLALGIVPYSFWGT